VQSAMKVGVVLPARAIQLLRMQLALDPAKLIT
jgi:hypothetical protein